MDPVLALARRHGLRVIEDCAQAHGARYRGRRCGSLGDAGCFSFYVTKNLGALGEGGFVATGDAALAERVRLLRHHGHVSKFEHAIVGYNLRLDEIQAAVLRLRLPHLEAGNARRRAIAAAYGRALADAVILTHNPWWVSWVTERAAVAIPSGGEAELRKVARHYGAGWVLLVPVLARLPAVARVDGLLRDGGGLGAEVAVPGPRCVVHRLAPSG
jgi:dTDP-4-amino-4,6-dideoxygalactose transaminase